MACFNDVDETTLGHILKYSNLFNLSQIARVNVHLRAAARVEFEHRYQQKKIRLVLVEITPEDYDEQDNGIKIYGLSHCLFIIRCFGDFIKNLSIDFGSSSLFRENIVLKYISKYCSQSMEVMDFCGVQYNLFNNFEAFFPHVYVLTFVGCEFNDILLPLNSLFQSLLIVNFDGWNSIKFFSTSNSNIQLYEDLEAHSAHTKAFKVLNPGIRVRFFI